MDQPLFIYGDYPAGTAVALIGAVAGQDGNDILQANEDTFVSPASTTLTLNFDLLSAIPCGVLALAGENLNGAMMGIYGSNDNFSTLVALSGPAALSGFTSVWRAYPAAAYRYLRITITGANPLTRLYHAAFAPFTLLPFMDDGTDLDAFVTTTNHIISPQGHFLGTQKLKSERKIPLSWGQILESEYQTFVAWAMACVQSPQGFFFVPDSSAADCYFGYTDSSYTFSAPMTLGLRSLAKITFNSRFV